MFGVDGQVMGNAILPLENKIDQDLKQSQKNVVDLVQDQAVSQDLVKVRSHSITDFNNFICKFKNKYIKYHTS